MRKVTLGILALSCFAVGTAALAGATTTTGTGISGVASNITNNLKAVAQLITAASYVMGLAFAVGAIVKFKAHKDNPTQIPIGTPIALLFVGAALIFAPTVIKVLGVTMFAGEAGTAGVSGIPSIGMKFKPAT